MPKKFTTYVDDKGRECTVCHKYKTRENYSYGGIQKSWRQSRCKECYNAWVKRPATLKTQK